MGCGIATECERGEFLMADYLTTDVELTSVANAIRTKGGTSAALTYPTGFVSAIQAIPTGGGASNFIEGTFTTPDDETLTVNNITLQYSGSGYPLCFVVCHAVGARGATLASREVLVKAIVKNRFDRAPSSSSSTRQGTSVTRYTLNNSSDNLSGTMYSTAATATQDGCVVLTSATNLQYYSGVPVGSSEYALAPSTEYVYWVIYSE